MYMCSITLLEIALAMLANCNEQRHKQFIAFDAAISKGPQLAEQQQSVCRQATRLSWPPDATNCCQTSCHLGCSCDCST